MREEFWEELPGEGGLAGQMVRVPQKAMRGRA